MLNRKKAIEALTGSTGIISKLQGVPMVAAASIIIPPGIDEPLIVSTGNERELAALFREMGRRQPTSEQTAEAADQKQPAAADPETLDRARKLSAACQAFGKMLQSLHGVQNVGFVLDTAGSEHIEFLIFGPDADGIVDAVRDIANTQPTFFAINGEVSALDADSVGRKLATPDPGAN